MIKYSLLTFLLLFIGYEIIVRSTDIYWTIGQNQWQSNIMRANTLIYDGGRYDNIMVGSSISSKLSAKISRDSLPESFYNLSFDGQSSFDGLRILENLNYKPKRLFIEMNIISREEDKSFTGALFSPVLFPAKKYLKSLRENYQPVEVIARMKNRRKMHPDSLAKEPVAKFVRDESTFQHFLKVRAQDNKQLLTAEKVRTQIGRLKEIVSRFQQKGVQVIFFEVPVDPLVCDLPLPVQIRSALEEKFEPMGCKFIRIPDCGGYYTSDVTHLERGSVYRYLRYFRNELDRQHI
ncbi:hypothetical protein [Dyadobacter sp. CY343]|uniref:hypothetical protein n=1 Tax=Dyadobacter sp. CY343 TaxID=2907299 RepID=UPI001F3E42FA|nr:hypothetical protein [Dyadobacter sp. CY343]MCE7061526.1 hypothetical protein [Dyadobacter sp. CY343]